jgi:hypothetical protein
VYSLDLGESPQNCQHFIPNISQILGERLAYKLMHEKYRSSTFGPAQHSHLHSKWSASSLQRQTISPKLSSGVRPPNPPPAGPRVLQLCGDSVLMVASTIGPTGAVLLAHKRSLGSPIGRQNSHPASRRIRRELTWTRAETTSALGGASTSSRKFSEERWRRQRTAPPTAELQGQSLVVAEEATSELLNK